MGKSLCLVLIAAGSLYASAAQAQQVVELESLDTLMSRSTGDQPSDRPSARASTPKNYSNQERSNDRKSEREARNAERASERAAKEQQREAERTVRRQLKGEERFARSLQFPKVKTQRAPKRVRTLPPTANRY